MRVTSFRGCKKKASPPKDYAWYCKKYNVDPRIPRITFQDYKNLKNIKMEPWANLFLN